MINDVSNEVFLHDSEVALDNVPISKRLVIPEIKADVSYVEDRKFVHALCVAVLHEIHRETLSLDDLESALLITSGSLKGISDKLFTGKYKPGQTKKGFGPFFVSNMYEALDLDKKNPLLDQFRVMLVLNTLRPFIKVEGLREVELNLNYKKALVDDSKLLEVCQAASVLQKFITLYNLTGEIKTKEGFFHPDEWLFFIREFRNRLIAEFDAADVFSDSAELVSVLLVANYLRFKNKFMLANSDKLNSNEGQLILSIDQFFSLGLKRLKALPTLVGPEMTGETLAYSVSSVVNPIMSSNLLKIEDLSVTDDVVYIYKDYALNSSVRGAIIIEIAPSEHPIQVIRKMDGFGGLHSYSNEFLEPVGKAFTDAAVELLKVCPGSDFDVVAERADFAIKGYFTNLDENRLRQMILAVDPSAVLVSRPESLEVIEIDATNFDLLDSVKFLYKKDINKRELEFDDVLGFRLVDNLMLEHPFLVALGKLHTTKERLAKIVSNRDKFYFHKFTYSKNYVLPAKGYNTPNRADTVQVRINTSKFDVSMEVNPRAILGISSRGTYSLNIEEFLTSNVNRRNEYMQLVSVLKASFEKIYGDSSNVTLLQADNEYKKTLAVIQNSLFFKRLGSKVYTHILQDLINADGKLDGDISVTDLNECVNTGFVNLVNVLLDYILQDSEFQVSEELINSNQFKIRMLTGGHDNV